MAGSIRLSQDAYVWQRAWDEPVRRSVSEYGSNFSSFVVLSAEVTWTESRPRVVHMRLDYPSLAIAHSGVGLAMRIGAYRGPFSTNGQTARFLSNLALSLVSESKAARITPRELQIDFDCAESKLDGYRLWVETIRRKVAPLPLTITALPAWLNQPAFGRLVAASDGYVLQVHSLERPASIDAPFTLCDPAAALRAVQIASRFNVPFRVALPTYGYLIAFDRNGRFVGLSAEGPAKTWPEGVQLREVRSEPLQLLALVRALSTNISSAITGRKSPLQGIVWYRLPNSDDIFNWRWPTLCAMMQMRSPKKSLRAEPRRVEAGLVDINLVNDGELDISSRLAIEVRWSREGGARLVAGDGLRGFELVDAGPSTARFITKQQSFRLPAGERQVIGWLRLSADREVQLEIIKSVESVRSIKSIK
jgi:hypothetical protein